MANLEDSRPREASQVIIELAARLFVLVLLGAALCYGMYFWYVVLAGCVPDDVLCVMM